MDESSEKSKKSSLPTWYEVYTTWAGIILLGMIVLWLIGPRKDRILGIAVAAFMVVLIIAIDYMEKSSK